MPLDQFADRDPDDGRERNRQDVPEELVRFLVMRMFALVARRRRLSVRDLDLCANGERLSVLRVAPR